MVQYRMPVFENICPGWGEVSHLAVKKTCARGSHIFDLETPVNGVYFIKEGIVEILLYTEHGPEKVLFQVHTGCVFGEVSCFASGESGEAVAVARSDCLLYYYPRDLIEGELAREHPGLLLELIRSLALKIRMYTILMKDSLISNPFTRVCKMLVYLAAFKGYEPGAAPVQVRIIPGITQSDLARMLGVHRVTVTKAVARLKTLGVLQRFTRNELSITDLNALCELAERDE